VDQEAVVLLGCGADGPASIGVDPCGVAVGDLGGGLEDGQFLWPPLQAICVDAPGAVVEVLVPQAEARCVDREDDHCGEEQE